MAGDIRRTPGDKTETIRTPGVGAATSAVDLNVWRPAHDVYIQKIELVLNGAMTAANADNLTLQARTVPVATTTGSFLGATRSALPNAAIAAGEAITVLEYDVFESETGAISEGVALDSNQTLFVRVARSASKAIPAGSVNITYRTR